MKALGKKPPPNNYVKWGTTICSLELTEHFRKSLMEAADLLEEEAQTFSDGDFEQRFLERIVKKLRISAGEKP